MNRLPQAGQFGSNDVDRTAAGLLSVDQRLDVALDQLVERVENAADQQNGRRDEAGDRPEAGRPVEERVDRRVVVVAEGLLVAGQAEQGAFDRQLDLVAVQALVQQEATFLGERGVLDSRVQQKADRRVHQVISNGVVRRETLLEIQLLVWYAG